jgi:hypothetical protein
MKSYRKTKHLHTTTSSVFAVTAFQCIYYPHLHARVHLGAHHLLSAGLELHEVRDLVERPHVALYGNPVLRSDQLVEVLAVFADGVVDQVDIRVGQICRVGAVLLHAESRVALVVEPHG